MLASSCYKQQFLHFGEVERRWQLWEHNLCVCINDYISIVYVRECVHSCLVSKDGGLQGLQETYVESVDIWVKLLQNLPSKC